MSLLMLATLLVYAVPGHASLLPHHQAPAPHEHVLADDMGDSVVSVSDHEHEQAPCGDLGLLDEGACCSVAQCVTMHGGLPAVVVEAFIPRPDTSVHLPVLATPDGIGIDPALRPPL
ncbi:hypothetical protein HL658_20000 [Azospirillum sp. RWY-5-1]|uniref:Secreted protein n=1 Tax=Azospirillum oleiclasticum TaxID=2735135 RepID=A0ABX2TDD8_9PROT|nr:hypothetical protein [Azospirillum oleiclasticum]NYZ14835.1 hypothetical protein [Azospirillum oleiclasticum]NYZ22179.1 hypothetical protein [Azospirillum oleiclasticum]